MPTAGCTDLGRLALRRRAARQVRDRRRHRDRRARQGRPRHFAPRLDAAGNSVKGQLVAGTSSRPLGSTCSSRSLPCPAFSRALARPVLLGVARRVSRSSPPVAGADLADERALAEQYRAGRPARRAGGGVRAGRAVRADRRRRAVRRADGRAARARGTRRPGGDRPARRRSRRPLRVPPRLPGNPLDPAATTSCWARRLTEDHDPRVYAHVATEPRAPGQARAPVLALLPLQRLQQHARGRLGDGPAPLRRRRRGRGARERAGRGRLQLARGRRERRRGTRTSSSSSTARTRSSTPPPARTRTSSPRRCTSAARPRPASAATTRAARTSSSARRQTIPSDRAAAAAPTLDHVRGPLGELQPAFFNGPTGPNLKGQWTEPIEWADDWRARSYAVPTGGVLGTGATDFFCAAVATGSKGLIRLLNNPVPMVLLLGALSGCRLLRRAATWRPFAPLRLARRRRWGQILTAGRMYLERARLFLGIGVLLIPSASSIALVEALLLGGFELLGIETGERRRRARARRRS